MKKTAVIAGILIICIMALCSCKGETKLLSGTVTAVDDSEIWVVQDSGAGFIIEYEPGKGAFKEVTVKNGDKIEVEISVKAPVMLSEPPRYSARYIERAAILSE